MGWELQERVWVEDRNEPFTVTEIWNNSKTGAGVLPVMGTVNSSFSTVYVSNRRFSYFPGGQNRACVITYKPYDSENPDPSSSFADLPRRWRINGEFISTQSDAPMYWASGAPNGDLVQQNIFRRLINQSYVITEVVTDMQIGTSNGPHGKIISKAGRVNSATWEGFGKGNWMYLGGEVDEISSTDRTQLRSPDHSAADEQCINFGGLAADMERG